MTAYATHAMSVALKPSARTTAAPWLRLRPCRSCFRAQDGPTASLADIAAPAAPRAAVHAARIRPSADAAHTGPRQTGAAAIDICPRCSTTPQWRPSQAVSTALAGLGGLRRCAVVRRGQSWAQGRLKLRRRALTSCCSRCFRIGLQRCGHRHGEAGAPWR